MNDRPTKVFIIDDSAMMRQLLADILSVDDAFEIVGRAANAKDGLEEIQRVSPDVVTLDIEMPELDGLTFLKTLMVANPVPVVMVSALTKLAADHTVAALEIGAMDYVPKPSGLRDANGAFATTLRRKLSHAAKQDVARIRKIRALGTFGRANQSSEAHCRAVSKPPTLPPDQRRVFSKCCIAIGISTGGPPALAKLFSQLAADCPPIVVVQHMPAGFTMAFAKRLDGISTLSIKEAQDGDELRCGQALIAPGGRQLSIVRHHGRECVEIGDTELVSGHCPSVDVMMSGVADRFGNRCMGVIMTGMGRDGVAGCESIRAQGGKVFGQDEDSSEVYGMNKAAYVEGHVDRQFSLEELPDLLLKESLEWNGSGQCALTQ